MVPQGTDGVAMVEYTESFGPDDIADSQSVAYGEHIVQPGDLLLRLPLYPRGLPAIASAPGKLTCWPCRLILTSQSYNADPVFGKSGLITTLTQADGYFIAPREKEGLQEGQTVMVNLF